VVPRQGVDVADCAVIKQNLQLLEKAVSTLDPRFTYRVLKMSNLRKRLSAEVLVQVIREVYPTDHPSVPQLLALLERKVQPLLLFLR
jgi:26S proteasome regulatory subunit N3